MTPDEATTAFRRWLNAHPVGQFPKFAVVAPEMWEALYLRAKREYDPPFCGPNLGLLIKMVEVWEGDVPLGEVVAVASPLDALKHGAQP